MKRHASESRTLLEIAVERGLVDERAAAKAAGEIGEQDKGERLVQLGLFDVQQLEGLRETFQEELRARSSFSQGDGARAPAHLAPPAAPASPQRRIGHYRLLEELGRGAMGVVHRALDERRNIEVALKLLPPEVADDAPRRRRLLEEARKAGMIEDCRHVVTVFEAGVVDDRAFLAMELVHGQTLEDWLATPGRAELTPDLLMQLIAGVAAAHSVGLVHRDIKPSNLMVTSAGVLKILDFGLAKDVVGPPSAESLDSVVGTPIYMAPELLQMALGLLPVDRAAAHSARVDVYSIGVTACEAFARSQPFPPMRSYGELLEQKLAVQATVRRALGKRPAWPWGRVVPQMLAPDPVARPADGVALQRLVRAAGDGPTEMTAGRRLVAVVFGATALVLGASEVVSPPPVSLPMLCTTALLVVATTLVLLLRPRMPKRRAPASLTRRPVEPTSAYGSRPQYELGAPVPGTDGPTAAAGSGPPSIGAPPRAAGKATRTPPTRNVDFDMAMSMSMPMPKSPTGSLEFHEEYWIGPFCLKVCVGDMTRLGAEGWVSPDDSRLTMGGGVSALINAQLGEVHRRAAAAHAPAPVGRVVVTEVVLRPVRYVLHAITIGVDAAGRAVPPTLAALSNCVDEVFQHARRLRLRSLAIPSLGTGAGRLPPIEVAKVICGRAIEQLADRTNSTLQTIVFVASSSDDPLLAAIRSRVLETGPREMVVRRGAGLAPPAGSVPVD